MARLFTHSSLKKIAVVPVRTTGCSSCGLATGCLHPKMEPTGEGRKKILVLAEAPGEDEDKKGVQLIGKVGQRVRWEFRALGIDLDRDCRKTNSVRCRPPGNRTPTPDEIAQCRKHIFDEIQRFHPKVILLLGGPAVISLLGGRWKHDSDLTISRWRGLTIPDHDLGCWICPTFHPSYVERAEYQTPAAAVLWKKDIQRAFSLTEQLLPKKLEPDVIQLTEPYQVEGRLLKLWQYGKARSLVKESAPWAGVKPGSKEWMRLWKEHPKYHQAMLDYKADPEKTEQLKIDHLTIALDYETTGLKPYGKEHRIVSCSIADGPEQVWAWMWQLNDSKIAALYRELMQLETVRKIGANIKFEHVWTRAKEGFEIKQWWWDTVTAAHVLDNRRANANVAFQTYTRLGILGFKDDTQSLLRAADSNALNRIDEIPVTDLLQRNGLDSAYEFAIAMEQRKEFGYVD